MRLLKLSAVFFLALAACLAPLTECLAATDEIAIPSTLEHIVLTEQTVASEIEKCISVPQSFLADITKNFPPRGSNVIQNDNGYFEIFGTDGYCVKKSKNKYPVFAIEAFYKTANPNVSQDVADKWYKEIATIIAKKGRAKVAYVYDNGNATIVDYSTTQTAGLLYPNSFKKAGEWESENIDARFSDKSMKEFRVTKYDNKVEKPYLLSHRK